MPFPDMQVGQRLRVRVCGTENGREKIGQWIDRDVTHIQRDRQGAIAALLIEGVGEFDPRNQFEDTGPHPCFLTDWLCVQLDLGMTDEDKLLARHALGLPNEKGRSYRNWYTAAPGTPSEKAWTRLVEVGLAKRGQPFGSTAIFVPFRLTYAGACAARFAGETLDREDFPEHDPIGPRTA